MIHLCPSTLLTESISTPFAGVLRWIMLLRINYQARSKTRNEVIKRRGCYMDTSDVHFLSTYVAAREHDEGKDPARASFCTISNDNPQPMVLPMLKTLLHFIQEKFIIQFNGILNVQLFKRSSSICANSGDIKIHFISYFFGAHACGYILHYFQFPVG